ncbi:MAG: C4-dicarboxylate ABC transporter permease [Firmicutes bacterium HGW-Firmicutes-11]|jgi:tripartite ATP-independent transporter DctM subunit|nr:MAG: C4-dicarboxylate ABC transporter permease [Firmicutes bacterium HGW-Firmicutes-11]
MEWSLILSLFLFFLVAAMFTGLPVAFSFLAVSGVAIYLMLDVGGLKQLVLGMQSQLSNFNFTPIPFFVIMGEVFFRSGIITRTMDSLSKLVRRVPGRLSVITLLGGGIFASLSGSSLANTAMFGSLMMPEMMRRGYSKEMTTGSIMASGALAMIIPPSNQVVMMGGIASISVAKILVGAIGPGILLLVLYLLYVIISCLRNPSLAPVIEDDESEGLLTTSQKMATIAKDILPLLLIFIVVIGVIFTGVGTATEAAAFGALGSYILAMAYRKFNFKLLFNTIIGSLRTTTMLMLIIGASAGFSQVLSMTGASREAVMAVTSTITSPVLIIFVMMAITFVLGLFIEQSAIMMICLPLFMPIVYAFGIDEIWFAVLFLILLQVGQFTPPVGMSLFVMKGVSPPSVTMQHIIRGAIPFLIIDIIAVVVIVIIPKIVTVLPSLI